MKILAIETSCDETALALIEAKGGFSSPKFKILKNLISSQIMVHRPFGGIVPFLAKREHIKNLPKLFKNFFDISQKNSKPDLLAVTVGPGLEPALWSGINFLKEVRKKYFPKTKIIGVNHLEGHLYSFLLSFYPLRSFSKIFPAVALIVSGGHSILLLMTSLKKWKKLGETRDDAAGEAFDKVGRMLGLNYPAGPEIEKLAKKNRRDLIEFPRPMIKAKNYDFSFAGLKTAVFYYLLNHPKASKTAVASAFQKAAVEVLTFKTIKAAKEFKAKSIILCGGVAANKKLCQALKLESAKLKINFFHPPKNFNTDNAAMIAIAAYFNYLNKKFYRLKAQPHLNI